MQNRNSTITTSQADECYLPNFCDAETSLRLVLVLELVAIVFSLADVHQPAGWILQLALVSILILWIGLFSAALLCLIRRRGWMQDSLRATVWSLLIVVLLTAMVSWLAYQIDAGLQLGYFAGISSVELVLRFSAISLVLFGMALRYFYFQFSTRKMVKTESSARLQALQARIRPHFLFNSLNTIASLTHAEPDKAERAIEELADLFRASMKADARISLADEITLTRDYIHLESLRLDDRLTVIWDIHGTLDDVTLPALMLQPLVENAIYHGVEPQPDGGVVEISIRLQERLLYIEITNPLTAHASSRRTGNQMALENIRERLHLAYQGRAKITQRAENDLYKVAIEIPVNDKGDDEAR